MQIILDFNERETLKRIERYGDRATTTSRTRTELSMVRDFYDAGLIRGIPLQPFDSFGPLYITPLGRRVLRESSPYIDPDNKDGAIWGVNQIVGYGIPK